MKTKSRLFFQSLIIAAFTMVASFNSEAQTASQYTLTTSSISPPPAGSTSLTTDLNGNIIPAFTTSITSGITARSGSAAMSIGFTFPYLGSTYTYISFNTNGIAKFASSSSNVISVGTSTINGGTYISPFSLTMITSSSGNVGYATSGTAPFRCFVIQWKNMGINSNSITSDGTFQLRIYENTGVIEFVYGTMAVGSTKSANSTTSFTTGFSDGVTNYLSISNTSTNTISTSSSMTSFSITTASNITNLSNKIYRFYPPQTSLNISSLGLTSSSNISFSNTVVTINQNTTLNNIYVNDNSKLSLASGVTLICNGDIICSTNGFITGNSNALITLNGSGSASTLRFNQTTIGTTNKLKNLTLNRTGGTATLANRLEITSTGTVTLTAGQLIINDTLKLSSDSNGTAMFDIIPTANLGTNLGGTNAMATFDPIAYGASGAIKACQYIPADGRRWRFLSTPIKNSNFRDLQNEIYITGAGTGTTLGALNTNGFDATATNSASVYTFNETTYSWVALTNSTSSLTNQSVTAGKGYRIMVRGDRSDLGRLSGTNNTQNSVSIDFNGDFNRGTVSIPVTYTGSASTPGWNMVSNPYPASFSWSAFYNAGNVGNNGTYYTNIDPTIYIFNAATNSYISYNALSNVASNPSFANGIIPQGATFFIKTVGANPSLTFKEQFKITTSQGPKVF